MTLYTLGKTPLLYLMQIHGSHRRLSHHSLIRPRRVNQQPPRDKEVSSHLNAAMEQSYKMQTRTTTSLSRERRCR